MATISRLNPGQIVWKVERQKMGNTTVSRGVLRRIEILEVDPEGQFVVVADGRGQRRRVYERQVKGWRVNKPEPKGERFGLPTY